MTINRSKLQPIILKRILQEVSTKLSKINLSAHVTEGRNSMEEAPNVNRKTKQLFEIRPSGPLLLGAA